MARRTLLDFFADLDAARGEFVVHDDGYRVRRRSYGEVAAAARGFAARLQDDGLRRGDAVVLWSENRAEWIAAFWGCLLAGAVVVPIDYRSSQEFVSRVAAIVGSRRLLVGDEVAPSSWRPASPGTGASAERPAPAVERWRLADLDWRDTRQPASIAPSRDDVVEVIFTSGATADPKGVTITHGNILANIEPIEREILKYRSWGRPFFPLRFLDLLPLSHLFGQAMATFIPPLLQGTVVFTRSLVPAEIVAAIRAQRVSVVVSVPKILDVLRGHVEHAWPVTRDPLARHEHVARRWWRYRAVHRAFGPKFWCFVVGAAPLERPLEDFWSRLGFLVVQGYGLTETAPIVSLNHPFASGRGSVGKPIAGTTIRLAADGEILVRGENVTPGYFGDERASAEAFEDGWLHTGDIGELDAEGRLFVRGRKKELIVTPEGLNVYPDDVERVLDTLPGVRESAVVGVSQGGEERVHAVLAADTDIDLDALVREANGRLADHQRIRGASRWPGPELPRTEGTRKLRRGEVRKWVQTGRVPDAPAAGTRTVEAVMGRFARGRAVTGRTTLEELGLSSLDRVELTVALEERFGTTVDEGRLADARTIDEIKQIVDPAGAERPEQELPPAAGAPQLRAARESGKRRPPSPSVEWRMPSWNRARPARWFRAASLAAWVLPAARWFARLERVDGLEHLRALGDAPVVFAANHQSHMDTPAVLAALPAARRHRLAVAMAKEYFDAHFHPAGHRWRDRFSSTTLYLLAALFFNAFPLPQREAGTRRTLRYIGELVDEGWSLLIYPEGERTDEGAIGRFRPGVGMMASRLAVPVVPVRLEGLERVLHRSWNAPRRGAVRVTFGAPMRLEGDDYAGLAARVESAVRQLG
jgi:long-chain acyl-CoA synthetase